MAVRALALVLVAAFPAFAQDQRVLTSGSARYVMGQLGQTARDVFVLDTNTGRVWQRAEMPDGSTVLLPIFYRTANGMVSLTPIDTDKEAAALIAAQNAAATPPPRTSPITTPAPTRAKPKPATPGVR